MRIVDNVADEWGARLDEDGKTLWAEFRRPADDSAERARRRLTSTLLAEDSCDGRPAA
jgi:hypothetical protein